MIPDKLLTSFFLSSIHSCMHSFIRCSYYIYQGASRALQINIQTKITSINILGDKCTKSNLFLFWKRIYRIHWILFGITHDLRINQNSLPELKHSKYIQNIAQFVEKSHKFSREAPSHFLFFNALVYHIHLNSGFSIFFIP